jgi:Domain of unknown function (DUF4190)
VSITSPGPGWWQASDAKWYPPESRPPPSWDSPVCALGHPQLRGAVFCSQCGSPIGPDAAGQAGIPGPSRTNGLAISALVLGILLPVGSILAVIFGHIARRQIRRSAGSQGGEGLAVAGLVLGWVGVALILLVIVLSISVTVVPNSAASKNGNATAQSNLTNAVAAGTALYQVDMAFESEGQPYGASDFSDRARQFTWNLGTACPTTVANCVSAQIFDVGATGDAQGLSLAVDSPPTDTCWFAFYVGVNPGVASEENFPAAGLWYGKMSGIPKGGCIALDPNIDPGVRFGSFPPGTDYENATPIS